MQWDFWTLSPESAHQVTWLMGDRGIPKTWRHMNGYSSHTYSWINAAGEIFWVKYHFITDQGVEFLTQAEADQMAGIDGDCPPARPVLGDRARRAPELDAEGADHAVRGGEDLPVQPVRPDQGVAARRLPAARGGEDDVEPKRRRLPHRDGAGRVRAEQPGRRDRAVPGQDAAGPRVLLRRRAPCPARGELQADPGQLAPGRGARLLQGRRDAGTQRRRPGVRAELLRRLAGRSEPGRRAAVVRRRRDGPLGVHAATTTTGARPARWSVRCSTTPPATAW